MGLGADVPEAAVNKEPLYIEGKLVTERNAWRFVKARRPNAEARRDRGSYSTYVVVRDRTVGAPWCHATGKTAGEAWLRAARQMVEYDAREADNRKVLDAAIRELTDHDATSSELQVAALRYSAVKIEQSNLAFGAERQQWADALRKMAEEITP